MMRGERRWDEYKVIPIPASSFAKLILILIQLDAKWSGSRGIRPINIPTNMFVLFAGPHSYYIIITSKF